MTNQTSTKQELARKAYRIVWHSLRVLDSGNLPEGTTVRDFTQPVEYARKWFPGMVEHLEALITMRVEKREYDASWDCLDDTLQMLGYTTR